jgi:anti-sigma-K factor RskA
MNCEEFEELSGAYALDAVTPAEREAARAHLAECANCTRRLRELRAVVDLLPYSTTQVNPPDSLKGRVLESIRNEGRTASTQPIPMSSRARWRWSTQLLAIAAVLMLLLIGGMTAWNVSLHQQNTSLAYQVTSLQHRAVQVYAIQGIASAQGASGKAIYLPEQNITLLVIQGLPQLQGTQVYQGWLIHGKQPRSIGLLSMENDVASVTYPGNIAGYEVAAVSIEPGPLASKSAPAGPFVAVVELTPKDSTPVAK